MKKRTNLHETAVAQSPAVGCGLVYEYVHRSGILKCEAALVGRQSIGHVPKRQKEVHRKVCRHSHVIEDISPIPESHGPTGIAKLSGKSCSARAWDRELGNAAEKSLDYEIGLIVRSVYYSLVPATMSLSAGMTTEPLGIEIEFKKHFQFCFYPGRLEQDNHELEYRPVDLPITHG